MTLANIINQRKNHRWHLWQDFISQVLDQVEHADLLPCLTIGSSEGD